MLQIICRLPVRVPEARLPEAALFLHRINQGHRIGCFCLNPKERIVAFRLAVPLRDEVSIESQIGEAVRMAMGLFDGSFPLLCVFLFDNEATRRRLDELMPDATAARSLSLNWPGSHPELN